MHFFFYLYSFFYLHYIYFFCVYVGQISTWFLKQKKNIYYFYNFLVSVKISWDNKFFSTYFFHSIVNSSFIYNRLKNSFKNNDDIFILHLIKYIHISGWAKFAVSGLWAGKCGWVRRPRPLRPRHQGQVQGQYQSLQSEAG